MQMSVNFEQRHAPAEALPHDSAIERGGGGGERKREREREMEKMCVCVGGGRQIINKYTNTYILLRDNR